MISKKNEKQSVLGKRQVMLDDLSIVYIDSLLCNIKHTSWSYENEFRCTMGADSKGMPYVDAKPKEIYIGLKCAEEHATRLINIANTLKVPVHKMVFDECSSLYDLTIRD